MAFNVELPKYIRLARTIQRQIEDGAYKPGELLPSENRLRADTGYSRPTVVRALSLLKQDGWIESRHGYGTVVRGRPEPSEPRPRLGLRACERIEAETPGRLVDVGHVRAPQRIADLLDVSKGAMVVRRRFLVEQDGHPEQVACSYFPKAMCQGARLADPGPLDEPLRAHVEARHRIRYDHVKEHVTARRSTDDEADMLGLLRGSRPTAAHSTTSTARTDFHNLRWRRRRPTRTLPGPASTRRGGEAPPIASWPPGAL
ncbi:hypothetical protein GCM10018793_61730 [Streptomyces sulfonofaciens]|uniref:HTH gntR-type domain-containing protein n=1 Tax=Streptomyces sulfonofaciens TaxID=68272 RepID=A0A919GM64_9ACTN|nr:GntR family transcriptional regulator [Streptomyces sulfonofaciens]GHH87128.1 hypothetical protein GCM10018793_61730 [Streptomyces sulfonofaciens]